LWSRRHVDDAQGFPFALRFYGKVTPTSPPQLRVARPSRDLHAAQRFYTRALGFQVLATFTDHLGIDGVILGHQAWPYHLEFTRRREQPIQPRPTDEDLLVFYLPEPSMWHEVVRRCHDVGALFVRSSNPYWNEHGVTLEDPDGYSIVLQQAAWESNRD
jgi:catechol 2,3-dioxygenase-like lactoylglutathione lyase family enzyme